MVFATGHARGLRAYAASLAVVLAVLATPVRAADPEPADKPSTPNESNTAQKPAPPGEPVDLDAVPAAAPPAADEKKSGDAAASSTPVPITLAHPTVVDTAKLSAEGQIATLSGIVGASGDPAAGLQTFIASAGDRVTCQPTAKADYVCLLPDGTDVAQVALINGAAQAKQDAPEEYLEQQSLAQAAQRGVWADLPPPPIPVSHPTIKNTGGVIANGKTYLLDGVDGLNGHYAHDMQSYIAAHGDGLMCQPQGPADHFLCLLGDGTDIAKVALVNGAARVALDAPDSYRLEQGEALTKHRGLWATAPAGPSPARPPAPQPVGAPPPAMMVMAPMPPPMVAVPPPSPYGVEPAVVGLSYVGGAPVALIGGETVFLVYADGPGWGYWDHYHRWHGAPERFREHLDHFHPRGEGFRGYAGHHGGPAHAAAGAHPQAHSAAFVRPAAKPAPPKKK